MGLATLETTSALPPAVLDVILMTSPLCSKCSHLFHETPLHLCFANLQGK